MLRPLILLLLLCLIAAASETTLRLTVEPTHTLAPRVWRDETTYSSDLSACTPVTLTQGTIVYKSTTITLDSNAVATFRPQCLQGHPVTNVDRVGAAQILTARGSAWREWITSDNGGFHASLCPLLYSLSSSMLICLLLSIVILDGPRRPFFQKLSIVLSSIYLLVVFITATIDLREQYAKGYLDAETLRIHLKESYKISILNLVLRTILLMAQVQVLMSLFPRQKEKRLIFWLGGCLIIINQTLWGMSQFHNKLNASALPAFVYLFTISIAVIYAGCVIYYTVTKYRSSTTLWMFTTATIMATLAPIALFIIDVGGWWQVEATDSVSWLLSSMSIVIVWEWAQRVEKEERKTEGDRVLGRQVFEDDMDYPIGKQQDDSNSGGGGGGGVEFEMTNMGESEVQRMVMPMHRLTTPMSFSDSTENAFVRAYKRVKSPVVWLSDQLVELGYFRFAIRSSSNPSEDGASHRRSADEPMEQFIYPMPRRDP